MSMASQRLVEMFRYLMAKHSMGTQYVDDILGISPKETARTAYDYLLQLLAELNFSVSERKLVEPTTECNCLGVIINTVAQTINIPEGKGIEILQKCEDVLRKKFVTKRKLHHVHTEVFKVIQIFYKQAVRSFKKQ